MVADPRSGAASPHSSQVGNQTETGGGMVLLHRFLKGGSGSCNEGVKNRILEEYHALSQLWLMASPTFMPFLAAPGHEQPV